MARAMCDRVGFNAFGIMTLMCLPCLRARAWRGSGFKGNCPDSTMSNLLSMRLCGNVLRIHLQFRTMYTLLYIHNPADGGRAHLIEFVWRSLRNIRFAKITCQEFTHTHTHTRESKTDITETGIPFGKQIIDVKRS